MKVKITGGGNNSAIKVTSTETFKVKVLPPEVLNLTVSGGGSVTDGDKGDIVVTGSGTVWSIESALKTTWDSALQPSAIGSSVQAYSAVLDATTASFTIADETKLDGIQAGAQVNVATNLSYTASTRLLESSTGSDVNLPVADGTNAGLMSPGDKTKLDGIAVNANNYSHPTQTALDSGTLTGAVVISRVAANTLGHLTNISTRTLTAGDIGAETAFSKGNIVQGNAIILTGALTSRLVGTGDITIAHADTSSQANVSNTNGNVIQSISVDTYGHITGLGSVNLDSRYPSLTGSGATGTWGINITGNSNTATTLQTPRAINGTSFNGSTDITTANWGTARTLVIGSTGKSVNGSSNVSWDHAEIGALQAYHYNARVTVGSWSRIARTNAVSLGGSYLLALNHTRLSVVVNAVFLITVNHANSGTIVQLSSGNYTQIQVRLTDIDTADRNIEILETGPGTGEVTYNVRLTNLGAGTATVYDTYIAGSGTVRDSLQSFSGGFGGNSSYVPWSDVATSGANKVARFDGSGYLAIDNWIQVGTNTGLYNSLGHYLYPNPTGGYAGWAVRSNSTTHAAMVLEVSGGGGSLGALFADNLGNIGFTNQGQTGWKFGINNSGELFSGTVPWARLTDYPTIIAGNGLTGGGTLAADRTLSVVFGTTAGTVAQGNDSRIINGQTAFGWGNHAGLYETVNNTIWRNRATILPEGAGNSLFDDARLNTRVTENGTYQVNNIGSTSHLITSATGGSTSVVQLGFNFDGDFRWRNRTDATNWQSWRTVWHSGNLSNPIQGSGTTNFLAKFTGVGSIGNSLIFDNGNSVLIGTTSELTGGGRLQVNGTVNCDDPIADRHAVTRGWANSNLVVLRTAGDATTGALRYAGTTRTAGQLYGGTTNPVSTTRLNYDGDFYANGFNSTEFVNVFSSVKYGMFLMGGAIPSFISLSEHIFTGTGKTTGSLTGSFETRFTDGGLITENPAAYTSGGIRVWRFGAASSNTSNTVTRVLRVSIDGTEYDILARVV